MACQWYVSTAAVLPAIDMPLLCWYTSGIVATKDAKKKLKFKPVTVYLTPDDHSWFKRHAEDVSHEEGQPISMTNIVRRVLVQYRNKVEALRKVK